MSGIRSRKRRQVGSCGRGPRVRNSKATLGRPTMELDALELNAAAPLRPRES